jgi:hypothetical protein
MAYAISVKLECLPNDWKGRVIVIAHLLRWDRLDETVRGGSDICAVGTGRCHLVVRHPHGGFEYARYTLVVRAWSQWNGDKWITGRKRRVWCLTLGPFTSCGHGLPI